MSIKNTLKVSRDFGHVVIEIKAPSVERFFASVGTAHSVEKYLQTIGASRRLGNVQNGAPHYKSILPFDILGSRFDNIYHVREPLNLFTEERRDNSRFDITFDPSNWFYQEDNPRLNLLFLQFQGIGDGATLKFRGMFQDEIVKRIASTLNATLTNIVNLSKPCQLEFVVEDNGSNEIEEIVM